MHNILKKMKVKCNNKTCSDYGEIREVEDWSGTDSYSLFLLKKCPICGSQRKTIELKVDPAPEGFNVYFGKFSAMSKEDQKRVLKKRSQDHFKKNIKGKKDYMDRKFYGLED